MKTGSGSSDIVINVRKIGLDHPPFVIAEIGINHEGSYEKALQAFTLNRTVPTMEHAKVILDEMIEANRDYWPALQKAWQNGEAVKK